MLWSGEGEVRRGLSARAERREAWQGVGTSETTWVTKQPLIFHAIHLWFIIDIRSYYYPFSSKAFCLQVFKLQVMTSNNFLRKNAVCNIDI